MDTREQYIERLKKQLDLWNAEVTHWETKAREAQGSVRAGFDQRLQALQQQRDQALTHLRQVQGASGDAWKDLMRGTDDAWAKLREAFDKARSHFQK